MADFPPTLVVPTERLVVISASPRTSPLIIREALFLEEAEVPGFLAALDRAGVHQAIVLSTCDRTEVQAYHEEPERVVEAVVEAFADRLGRSLAEVREEVELIRGADVVRHVFSVAASLDSLVLGEPQVLGQVKESHRQATAAGMVGRELESLLQAAYATAKRARTETAIGEKPVSIAAAAVQLARDLHGDLEPLSALVIGAGEMGDLLVEGFRQAGLTRLIATAPTPARAEALARHLDCHEAPFEALAETLAGTDVVLTALGSRRYLLSVEVVEAALKARRHRPILVVDGGIPGDVEPVVGRLEDAFLFDLADLEKVAWRGMAERERVAAEARAIVEAGVESFLHGQLARSAVPVLRALRAHFEEVRREVLDDGPAHDAGEATRRLVNRLLHLPSESLRGIAATRDLDLDQAEALIRRLFRLGAEDPSGSGEEGLREPKRGERR